MRDLIFFYYWYPVALISVDHLQIGVQDTLFLAEFSAVIMNANENVYRSSAETLQE